MSNLPDFLYVLHVLMCGLMIIDNSRRQNHRAVCGWLVAMTLSFIFLAQMVLKAA